MLHVVAVPPLENDLLPRQPVWRLRRGRIALLLLSLPVASQVAGCGAKRKAKVPYVIAASEKDAQTQIRRLEARWELSTQTGKKELRPELEEFVRRHPQDPSAQQANLMLAQLAVLERRLEAASALVGPLLKGKKGRIRDEAELVMAAIEIRQGKVEAGLQRLAPLEGKLLSHAAEETFYRERISAALTARRWRLAVDSMRAWLEKQGESGGADARRWIEEALVAVPATALFHIVRPAEDEAIVVPEREEERWLQQIMIERIAHQSLAQEDARLARDLIQSAPPWLKAGKRGDSLMRLASLAQNAAHIAGRSLGFLLGGANPVTKSRNLRVAAGILQAISENRSEGRAVNYVTAEDQGSTAGALGALSGLGATYVLGGTDESSARSALLFAQARGVPTVVMTEPSADSPQSQYGFVCGVSEREEVEALAQNHEGAGLPFVLGGKETPCSEVSRPQIGAALAQGNSWLVVLGDARCLHLATTAAYPFAKQIQWSLGLAAASGPFPPGWEFNLLTAGSFPKEKESDGPSPGDQIESSWDWYFALGYDSAQLVIRALIELPTSSVSEREQVRAHHQRAAKTLGQVRTELVTTHERGFDDRQRLGRVFSIRQLRSR